MKRKAADDISTRPLKIVRSEIQRAGEDSLLEKDLKSLTLAVYRERRKEYPCLPKSRDEVHDAISSLNLETNKKELFCLGNSKEHGNYNFSCYSNLHALCTSVSDIFVDGAFKYCPKYFE